MHTHDASSFVMPEIVLGVAMFMVVALIPKFTPLGTWAQIVELVTYQLSYPVIMVRARMLSIGKEYEEAAIDLGAPPRAAIRRILLPLQSPETLRKLRDRVRVADAGGQRGRDVPLGHDHGGDRPRVLPVSPRGERPTDGGRL